MNTKYAWLGVSALLIISILGACGGTGSDGGGGGLPVTPTGIVPRFAYVANSTDSTVSMYTVNAVTGQLRHNGYVTTGANPVSVSTDPSGKFAYVVNNSGITAYTINTNSGMLKRAATLVSGTGSASVTIDPSGKFAYVANYGSNDISAYSINAVTGALSQIACSGGASSCNGSNFLAGTSPIYITIDPTGKFAYVANYNSHNISAYRIDTDSGALTSAGTSTLMIGTNNPDSISVDPSGQFVYVANWGSNDVSVFTINATTGALTRAGAAIVAGTKPASIIVDPSGKFVYVANWGSNDISVFTINVTSGALTKVGTTNVAAGTSPNSVIIDASGKFAYVANLASDNVSIYSIDAGTGTLTALTTVTGRNGSRAIAMTKGTEAVTYTPKFAYVANSLSNTVSTYAIDANTGALSEVDQNGSAAGTAVATGTSPGSVSVDPSGKFAYVANIGSNTISAYAIDANTGALSEIDQNGSAAGNAIVAGPAPESVTVDPSGRFAYVTNSNNTISAYTIDTVSGALTEIDQNGPLAGTTVSAGVTPRSISIDPSGKFAYVANQGDSSVSAYTINVNTGALTSVGTAIAAGGEFTRSVSIDPLGKFVFAVNHGGFNPGSIAVYGIDAGTGTLTPVSGSPFVSYGGPNSVNIDPTGKFAYVSNSYGSSWVYQISPFGRLTPVDIAATTDEPVSIRVDPSGKFVYTASNSATYIAPGSISGYMIDSLTGSLTAIAGSPFLTGIRPANIAISGSIR